MEATGRGVSTTDPIFLYSTRVHSITDDWRGWWLSFMSAVGWLRSFYFISVLPVNEYYYENKIAASENSNYGTSNLCLQVLIICPSGLLLLLLLILLALFSQRICNGNFFDNLTFKHHSRDLVELISIIKNKSTVVDSSLIHRAFDCKWINIFGF